MSFGASPSDIVTLFKALDKLTGLLKRDAVDDYERCVSTYSLFSKVARYLDGIQIRNDIGASALLTSTRKDIEELLKSFFSKIHESSRYLGKNRVRKSLPGALAKIKWHRHAPELGKLREDLESRLNVISIVYQISGMSRAAQGSIHNLPGGDHFVFQNANLESCLLDLTYVSNWEHLHELLLRMYKGCRGSRLIETKSYLIHNATNDRDFLPSSPYKRALQDVIKSDERIEMSVILPQVEVGTEKCPGCNTDRKETSVWVTCHQCHLQVGFYDSYDGKIDPLTQLAINDIRQSGGLRAFTQGFLDEIKSAPQGASSEPDRNQLREMLGRQFRDAKTRSSRGIKHTAREIRHFKRAVLCSPQWPDLGSNATYAVVDRNFAAVMEGIKRRLEIIEAASDMPLKHVARAIGSRFGRWTVFQQFFHSTWLLYKLRKQRPCALLDIIEIYARCAQHSMYPFHPSVVRARCFLWTISQVLDLEASILHNCSQVFKPLAVPEGTRPHKIGAFQKAFQACFVPHIIVFRLTADLAQDIQSYLLAPSAPEVLIALFHVLHDSWSLSLEYFLEGHLGKYEPGLPPLVLLERMQTPPNGVALADWPTPYSRCLESVMISKGSCLEESPKRPKLFSLVDLL